MKYGIGLFLVVAVFFSVCAQNNIDWKSWEEVVVEIEKEPRKVFVDVHTEWCGWCKKMDNSTFKNDSIVKYINDNFYAIKFDAETKRPIEINGKTFNYVSHGKKGYHELASQILKGKLSFPSLVFLDSGMNVIQPIPGYRDAKTLEMILKYYEGDFHKKVPWKTFTSRYEKHYRYNKTAPENSNTVSVSNKN